MKVLLCQLDGKIPNLAIMRIAKHHAALGHTCELRFGAQFEKRLWDSFDKVYASAIFEKTRTLVERLKIVYPNAIVGGTGVDASLTLEAYGITEQGCDYSLFPRFRQSIGFTQRGCRLKCGFCVVPQKEGRVRRENTIADIWRGDPWPREILLLDNDFFGQDQWRDRLKKIRDGGFKVSFNQGINCRFLTDETAEAIASVDYRDDSMQVKRIYTAWDAKQDHRRVMDGLGRLVKYGVKPDHIMVYMLVGYWPGETHEDREIRRQAIRDFGARPYPMPFRRTPELVGYQRWVVGAYDKRVPWRDWALAKFEPRKLADSHFAIVGQSFQFEVAG